MAFLDFFSDRKPNGHGQVQGSDGRLNVSSRSDTRGYYISRDEGRAYSVAFDQQSCVAGEFPVYWQNTDTNARQLVVSHIGLNSVENVRFKLWFVTGTAAGGTLLTPVNLNKTSANAASAISREGPVTGLTTDGLIDFAYCSANGHEEFRLADEVRLGQNDAIAIEYAEGTTGDCSGVIFGFYESI